MHLGKVVKTNNIAFRGYDKHLDKKGNPIQTFYYPHSDDYKLQLEILKENTDDTGELTVYEVENSHLDIPEFNTKNGENYYYRFKLIDKNHSGKAPIYANDNGIIKDFQEKINGSSAPFNKIFPDRKIVSKPGIMQLQMPDMYYPGIEYKNRLYKLNKEDRAKALSTLRTHANKLGGTLDGMTWMLPIKAKEGYTRIVGTPFTKDEVTSHLYWTQNAYQMASSLGGLQSMKRFQQALFRNGINFVSDAALVNEGLQGIHFADVMKHGQNSPFFYWFKTYDLDLNKLTLGILPENSKYVKMKIVNSPVKTKANPVENGKYNPNLPTYVQVYDSRLVSSEQEKADKVFTKYDKNPNNHYEITRYEDVVMPYSFVVNPNELSRKIKEFSAYNAGDFSGKDNITNLLDFSNFRVGERKEGGVELWDGNVDIAKLNFSLSNYDFENDNKNNGLTEAPKDKGKIEENNKLRQEKENKFKQGVREVQDYAVLSGKYWAKLAADTQLEYAASAFKNVKNVNDALAAIKSNVGSILPKSVLKEDIANDKELLENVLNNKYNLFKLNNISSYSRINEKGEKESVKINSYEDILTKSIMNLPFEVLEVADDTAAIMSSGYLSKRAGNDKQIGLTRFDIYKANYSDLPARYEQLYKKTDFLLKNDIYNFADKIIKGYFNYNNSSKLKDNDGNLTPFAKYIINAVVPDLTKYALLKALDKDANIIIKKDGSLNFDEIDRTRLSVNSLKIAGNSTEEEAKNLVKKLENGLASLTSNQSIINNMIVAMTKRFEDLNENSFKLADMIVDRTESGIGLRVDAAKDIAAIDSVRENKDNISKAWKDTIEFWSKYVKDGIQSENPHAFSTAEVTDIDKFVVNHKVDGLNSPSEADRIMLEKTGVTSIANYSYLFAMPTGMYSSNPESGTNYDYKMVNNIKSKLDCLDTPEWRDNMGMLFQGPADSSIHSYTFSGNHDKPRILHVLGLDMGLYNSDFSDEASQDAVKQVFCLDNLDDFDMENLSAPAVAMGKRLQDVFGTMKQLSDKEKSEIETDKKRCIDKKMQYIPENDSDNEQDRVLTDEQFNKIKASILRLAKGIYQVGENSEKVVNFNPDSFGNKPFDVVINDVLKTADLGLNEEEISKISNIALKKVMLPAMEKCRAIYKMLMLLPGDPTDFAGDKEALSGFESKSKNMTQQNRNAIRWEWLDKDDSKNYKQFVDEYKKSMNSVMALRLRPELSALNDGHTVSLVNYDNCEALDNKAKREYSAIFRYNAKGSQVIAVFGRPDLDEKINPNKPMGDKTTSIKFLNLGTARSREGLSAGLKVGTKFINANPKDNSEYIVEKRNITVPKLLINGQYTDDDIDYPNYKENKYYKEEQKESYVLQRYVDGKPKNIEVGRKDDNALVLYKKA